MRDIAPARGGSLGACSQRGILHRPDRGVFTWANFLSTPCATPTSPPRGRSAARASRTHASAPLRLMPPVHPLNPGVGRPTWSAGGLCPFVDLSDSDLTQRGWPRSHGGAKYFHGDGYLPHSWAILSEVAATRRIVHDTRVI